MALAMQSRIVSRPFVRLARFGFQKIWPIHVSGFEAWESIQSPAIVVANHLSLLDGPLLATFSPAPLHFAVTSDFAARQPWKSGLDLMSLAGFGSYSAVDAAAPIGFRKLSRALANGNWVGIFPEGRISRTGLITPLMPGFAYLANKTRATVLPVRLAGTQYTMFGKVQPNHGGGKELQPLVLEALEPIEPTGNEHALVQRVQAVLSSCSDRG